MKRIVSFILKPFGENLMLLLSLWLLASAADVFYWSIHGNPVFGGYMGVHGLIQVYFIVLILGIFRGKAFRILKTILIALGVINLIADACVHHIMHFSFTGDMVAIILGSNASEAAEFLPMYLSMEVVGFVLAVLAMVTLLLVFGKKYFPRIPLLIQYILLAGLLLSVAIVVYRKSNNWEGLFLNKIGLFLSYEKPVDLSQYRSDPDIIKTGDQPETIVLIIGESLSKTHCSLYGYERETTPLLDAMAADSLIIPFNHIEAAYTNTVGAFKRFMSTYSNSPDNGKEWYEYTFLEDIVSSGGYQTYWISNQSSSGIYDNVVARFASLSDHVQWVGPKGMGIGKSNPDGDVLPYVEQTRDISGEKKFIIVHLMGSHEGFEARYTTEYKRFSPEDYVDKPEGQRWLLSAYDNSVLYSDYVVSSIMHLFDKQEALVIFFPDHSLDIFDSDPTYVGHARTGDAVSEAAGKSIPLVVYPTEKYRLRFPEKTRQIEEAVDHRFNMEELPYTIMDLANLNFRLDTNRIQVSLLNAHP